MSDLDSNLVANRSATESFAATATAVPETRWTKPRAPGKWSPAQLLEHVVLAHEMALSALRSGGRSGMPRIFRPIVRRVFFVPTIRRGSFPAKAKSPKILVPSATPGTRGELVTRLHKALDVLEQETRALASQGAAKLDHPFFGAITLPDFIRFNELHTQHHAGQFEPQ